VFGVQAIQEKTRAELYLEEVGRLYPRFSLAVERMLARRGRDLPLWPSWCLLPMPGWYAAVCDESGHRKLPPEKLKDVYWLAALGTWNYTKGIWRFEQGLQEALLATPHLNEMPSELFLKLPEWSLYIETRGMRWQGFQLYGFWAHLNWELSEERRELRLLLDTEQGMLSLALFLGEWTVEEAAERAIVERLQLYAKAGVQWAWEVFLKMDFSKEVMPLLALLAYICSASPEVECFEKTAYAAKYLRPWVLEGNGRLPCAPFVQVWVLGKSLSPQLCTQVAEGGGVKGGHWLLAGVSGNSCRWIPPQT